MSNLRNSPVALSILGVKGHAIVYYNYYVVSINQTGHKCLCCSMLGISCAPTTVHIYQGSGIGLCKCMSTALIPVMVS